MPVTTEHSAPPSGRLLLLEMRSIAEMGAYFSTYPLMRLGPRGDGHPVLVLPGLAASDTSTQLLRAYLKDRGYSAHGWNLGANHGPLPGAADAMQARLSELFDRYGQKVSLVGISLGGIFAREMAKRDASQVRCVITLGSPFAGAPTASHASQLYARLSRRPKGETHEGLRIPPQVPTTAIFSRSDGVVAWQGCREQAGPLTESIEVEGSHTGMGHNPAVLHAVADRLAMSEGQWRPFDRSGAKSFIYRDPYRE